MKSRTVAALSFIVLIFACQTAKAEGECETYTTSYDRTYCFAKLFLESDKELNDVYKELRGLVGDEAKQGLTQTQRDWIRFRNNTCERHGTINVDCNFRVNRERTEYLRDRVRECKTGHQRNNMIIKKSWN